MKNSTKTGHSPVSTYATEQNTINYDCDCKNYHNNAISVRKAVFSEDVAQRPNIICIFRVPLVSKHRKTFNILCGLV